MAKSKTNSLTSSVFQPSIGARLLFHFLTSISFIYIFCWHFGSEASSIEKSKGFGWFFKYLTFCGFTFQMIAFFVSFLSDLFPQANTANFLADNLSCASFLIANIITVMYWCLLIITKDPVDEDVRHGQLLLQRPPFWLSIVMHLANAIVAWMDILLTNRRFSKFSLLAALVFGFLYCIWMQICATKNKGYPYPFLNVLPEPEGLIGMALVGLSLILLFFWLGAKVASISKGKHNQKELKYY